MSKYLYILFFSFIGYTAFCQKESVDVNIYNENPLNVNQLWINLDIVRPEFGGDQAGYLAQALNLRYLHNNKYLFNAEYAQTLAPPLAIGTTDISLVFPEYKLSNFRSIEFSANKLLFSKQREKRIQLILGSKYESANSRTTYYTKINVNKLNQYGPRFGYYYYNQPYLYQYDGDTISVFGFNAHSIFAGFTFVQTHFFNGKFGKFKEFNQNLLKSVYVDVMFSPVIHVDIFNTKADKVLTANTSYNVNLSRIGWRLGFMKNKVNKNGHTGLCYAFEIGSRPRISDYSMIYFLCKFSFMFSSRINKRDYNKKDFQNKDYNETDYNDKTDSQSESEKRSGK